MGNTDLNLVQRDYLSKINHASAIMLSIINDILDFSKIESGKVDLEIVAFSLDDVIKNVLNIVSFKVDEKKLGLTLKRDPNIPNYFHGDAKRLEQILLNLMNNAIKFTSDGEITLAVESDGHMKNNYHLKFIVKDTGIGISEEKLPHLFQPFTQEDASINRRFGGTGLGLSIVKNLVELIEGHVAVLSNVGQGTSFVLDFNFECDREKEREKEKELEYIKHIKTLVYNQEIKHLSIINGYLRGFGLNTEFTSSKEQMLNMLKQTAEKHEKAYDLIVIDELGVEDTLEEIIGLVHTQEGHGKTRIMTITDTNSRYESERENEYILRRPIFPSVLYNGLISLFKFKVVASHIDGRPTENDKDSYKEAVVLVVEDNQTNQFIAKSLLDEIGVQVLQAYNGLEAVDIVKTQSRIDLILMDLHMPLMNGYEASEAILKLKPDMHIVAMTADAIHGVAKKCDLCGMKDFISKPFDPQLLIKSIKTYLGDTIAESVMGEEETKLSLDGQLIDFDMGLKLLGGNESLYKEVLKVFIEESVQLLQVLEKDIGDKHLTNIKELAHKIKGNSGNVGAEHVRHIASELQMAAQEGRDDTLDLAKHMGKDLRALLEQIKVYID